MRRAVPWDCPKCGSKRRRRTQGDFRVCPDCDYRYRWRLSYELSDAIDAYGEGHITADKVVQASFDQDFRDLTEMQ